MPTSDQSEIQKRTRANREKNQAKAAVITSPIPTPIEGRNMIEVEGGFIDRPKFVGPDAARNGSKDNTVDYLTNAPEFLAGPQILDDQTEPVWKRQLHPIDQASIKDLPEDLVEHAEEILDTEIKEVSDATKGNGSGTKTTRSSSSK